MLDTDKIAIIDDDPSICLVLSQFFKDEGYQVFSGNSVAEAQNIVEREQPNVILIDVMMADGNGLDFVEALKNQKKRPLSIIISAQNTMMTAMKAAEVGAFEYFSKPFDLTQLLSSVQRALRQSGAAKVEEPTEKSATRLLSDKSPMVGRSPAMQQFYKKLAQYAQTDMPVLIQGETGTGKELAAQSLHLFSQRQKRPFIALNMGALPRDLIESALFGHVKGAFTGAVAEAPGCFLEADGGTLFLDEIGDMPLEAQTKLLRVLQEGEYLPIGGQKARKVDVRIIAATHCDLAEMVVAGTFRQDLYYRLNVLPIELPALRDRLEDLPELVQFFCQKYWEQYRAKRFFSEEALALLANYGWPGNIRELENVIYRNCVISSNIEISPEQVASTFAHLITETGKKGRFAAEKREPRAEGQEKGVSALVRGQLLDYFAAHGHTLPPDGLYERILREVEKPLLEISLSATKGNQIQAAKLLGLNRNTLRKKITELKINIHELKRVHALKYDDENRN